MFTFEAGVNPVTSIDKQGIEFDYVLDAPLGTNQRIRKSYYSDSDCGSPIASTGTDLGLSAGAFTPVFEAGNIFTVAESILDIDASVISSSNTSGNPPVTVSTYKYCIRLTLETDDDGAGTAYTIDDILEVYVSFSTTLTVGTTFSVPSMLEATPLAVRNNAFGDSFSATAYLCNPRISETTDIGSTETIREGESLSFCFRSADYPGAGIVKLEQFTLAATLDEGILSMEIPASSMTTNTCTKANGQAGSETCYISVDQLPTAFFRDASSDVNVQGAAIVTLRVVDDRRFEEGATGNVRADVAAFTAVVEVEEETCECEGGFFYLICFLFRCVLGFF